MSNQKKYHILSGTKIIGEFEVSNNLRVRLLNNLNKIEVPIFFNIGYFKGQREFEGDIVEYWIKNRVVPSGRQNIDSILKQVGIEEYDWLKIFLYCNGKYTQDNFSIEPILDLSKRVRE